MGQRAESQRRLFSVDSLFENWLRQLKMRDLGTCSYEDFVKMCGTPECWDVCSSKLALSRPSASRLMNRLTNQPFQPAS